MTKKTLIIIVFSIACMLTNLAKANQSSQLNQKISNLQTTLTSEKSQQQKLQHQLATDETALGHVALTLHNNLKNQKRQQKIYQKLQKNAQTYQKTLSLQQQKFSKQIRAAYLLGREPTLKMLLNQQSIDKTSRMLMYFRYLSKQQITAIENLQTTLKQISKNQQHILQQQQKLEKLNLRQQKERNRLKRITQRRRKLVTQIDHTIHNKKQKLEQLIANKRRLGNTVSRLERRHQTSIDQGHFARLRGKLNWPTRGKVIAYFGTQLDQSGLRLDGDVIKAAAGQPVRAIANGKVIFAKWLAGYGLLLIVNHGKGFMTLYGRNHSLYKKVGDYVEAGQQIATVGNSGGFKQTTLYFAIRHDGKPLNPKYWIKRR